MATKPRLLYVISELNVGGSELSLLKLVPRLQPHFDNHIACAMGRGPVARQLAQAGLPVHYLDLSSRFTPLAISRLVRLIRQLQPTVIVGTLVHADLTGRLSARLAGRPFISNQRSSLHHRDWLRYLDWLTQRLVTAYVVQTEQAKEDLCRRGHVPQGKITVIPNLVELPSPSVPRSRTRENLGLTHDQVVITCVSNLRPGKGHECLLRAVSRSSKFKIQNSKILLVGDGPLRTQLEQHVRHLGLTDFVQFLGLREDVADILVASDIFVLPSEAEGMSNALLEAMAAGLPCIASDLPANRALIADGTTGLLFPVNNHQRLAQLLQTVANDPTIRYTLGSAARRHVQQHHAPTLIVEQWRALIEAVRR